MLVLDFGPCRVAQHPVIEDSWVASNATPPVDLVDSLMVFDSCTRSVNVGKIRRVGKILDIITLGMMEAKATRTPRVSGITKSVSKSNIRSLCVFFTLLDCRATCSAGYL